MSIWVTVVKHLVQIFLHQYWEESKCHAFFTRWTSPVKSRICHSFVIGIYFSDCEKKKKKTTRKGLKLKGQTAEVGCPLFFSQLSLFPQFPHMLLHWTQEPCHYVTAGIWWWPLLSDYHTPSGSTVLQLFEESRKSTHHPPPPPPSMHSCTQTHSYSWDMHLHTHRFVHAHFI